MELAKYICAIDDNWFHYGLSIPYYTHFTSSIRRYADGIVHGLLDMGLKSQEAAIELSNNQANLKHLTEVARHCNYRRERSVLIQSRCDEIYMAAYLKAQISPVEVDGMVVGLGQEQYSGIVSPMVVIEIFGMKCYH